MNHSRPQTVLISATKLPLILATQTGVTLASSRLKRKKRWEKADLLKILLPAMLVASLFALKSRVAFGAEIAGVNITPPQGWEVTEGMGGAGFVMQEPLADKAAIEKNAAKTGKDQTTFRRNITAAAIQTGAPIDEQRATELQADLEKRFGQTSIVRDYRVTEHKFFNYHGKNDGLVMYASMTLSDVSVMQMHILVSGSEKQYLLTYTDLAESISNPKNQIFEAAWNSMVSIDVTGEAPKRFDQQKAVEAGVVGGGLILALYIVLRMRRRGPVQEADMMLAEEARAAGNIESPSDFMLGSSLATLPVAWDLSGREVDDRFFDMPSVSSISNF